jgi:hypothetical protein
MNTTRLTLRKAQECARLFDTLFIHSGREWDISDVEYCLPAGWVFLPGSVTDSELRPATIQKITKLIRVKALLQI